VATWVLAILNNATKEIGLGNFTIRVDIKTKDEFQNLAESFNNMCSTLEEKLQMQRSFAHYVSKSVMAKIMSGEVLNPKGERKKITVFFCDIRDFTKIAEKSPPEEVMGLLNEYFQIMLDIVFKYNGMLDKLIGDAIMAEFGYPAEDEDQETNAVLAALEMQYALHLFRTKLRAEGKPEIIIGIGIHTGEAIVGTLGSKDRFEFTAIGDTVNIASRLETATKELNESIIISETTFKGLKRSFKSKPLGSLILKGKEEPINAFAILDDNK
jgi:adenylate cyclase